MDKSYRIARLEYLKEMLVFLKEELETASFLDIPRVSRLIDDTEYEIKYLEEKANG